MAFMKFLRRNRQLRCHSFKRVQQRTEDHMNLEDKKLESAGAKRKDIFSLNILGTFKERCVTIKIFH